MLEAICFFSSPSDVDGNLEFMTADIGCVSKSTAAANLTAIARDYFMNETALTKGVCQSITSGIIDHRLAPPFCMMQRPPNRKVEMVGMEAFMQKYKTPAVRRQVVRSGDKMLLPSQPSMIGSEGTGRSRRSSTQQEHLRTFLIELHWTDRPRLEGRKPAR